MSELTNLERITGRVNQAFGKGWMDELKAKVAKDCETSMISLQWEEYAKLLLGYPYTIGDLQEAFYAGATAASEGAKINP